MARKFGKEKDRRVRVIDRDTYAVQSINGTPPPEGTPPLYDTVIIFDPARGANLFAALLGKLAREGAADGTVTIADGAITLYAYDQWQLRREGRTPQH